MTWMDSAYGKMTMRRFAQDAPKRSERKLVKEASMDPFNRITEPNART